MKAKKQYTIRNVPGDVDRSLRQQAKKTGVSLNEFALQSLARGAGLAQDQLTYHDLDFLAGSWEEDPAFDQALSIQEQIDPEVWQ